MTPATAALHVLIQQSADLMRQRARLAAGDNANNRLCCWIAGPARGRDSVLEVREHPAGEDVVVITEPIIDGVAEHIAGAHPRFMLHLATFLDREAAWCQEYPQLAGSAHLAHLRALVDCYLNGRHHG